MRTPASELYRFRMRTEIHCGADIAQDTAPHLQGLDTSRISLIVDGHVKDMPRVQALGDDLAKRGEVQHLEGSQGEPDFEYLEALRDHARGHSPTLVVGVGGGSTMDAAKGLAIVLTNDGPCETYQGLELYSNPGVPCLTIPTLFGSGAELTPSAVFINRKKGKKGGINGPAVFPTLALVDPNMLESAPLPLIGATAMDALVHSIESYAARCSTPMTRHFAVGAVRALFGALNGFVADGFSTRSASLLAEGTFLGITSLMHSEQGLAGGASYPMGVFNGVPHGIGGGRCLPHALLLNASRTPGLWDGLAESALSWLPSSRESSAEFLARRLVSYMEQLQVPRLSQFLEGCDLGSLAREIHAFRGVMEQNPVDLSERDVEAFLSEMLTDEVLASH